MKTVTTAAHKNYRGEMIAKTLITGAPAIGGESDVEITTCKGSNGTVRSYFQYGTAKNEENFGTFTFVIFQSHRGNLCEVKARATEKAVNEQHTAALAKFMETLNKGTEAANV